ncbi:MAG: metallophosphoesterase [Thermodesulfobacteriota bacterium]
MKQEVIKLVHLSDLHFGREDEDKKASILEDLHEESPDIIVITGDILDFPYSSFYKSAQDFYNKLVSITGNNVFCVPGNHDLTRIPLLKRKFKSSFGEAGTFGRFITINHMDLFIAGIDTSDIWNFFTTKGKIRKSDWESVENIINMVKQDKGESRFNSSYKIFLLHHHPLPTKDDKSEGILYLKESGKFLAFLVDEGFDLVLHGHKHDPIEQLLSYNVGGEGEELVILSAGTSMRKENDSNAWRMGTKSSYYVISLYKDFYIVDKKNYFYDVNKFKRTKEFVRKRGINPYKVYDLELKYTVAANGDLLCDGEEKIASNLNCEINELHVYIGVTDRCPTINDDSELGLSVKRKNEELETTKIHQSDFTRRFVARLVKGEGIKEMPELIKFHWKWPGGWNDLVKDGVSKCGYRDPRRDIGRLTIKINLNEKFGKLKDIKVFHPKPESLNINGNIASFSFNEVKKNTIIDYKVSI